MCSHFGFFLPFGVPVVFFRHGTPNVVRDRDVEPRSFIASRDVADGPRFEVGVVFGDVFDVFAVYPSASEDGGDVFGGEFASGVVVADECCFFEFEFEFDVFSVLSVHDVG